MDYAIILSKISYLEDQLTRRTADKTLQEQVDANTAQLSSLLGRFNRLSQTVVAQQTQITAVQNEVDGVQAQVASLVESLDKEIADQVEAAIQPINDKLRGISLTLTETRLDTSIIMRGLIGGYDTVQATGYESGGASSVGARGLAMTHQVHQTLDFKTVGQFTTKTFFPWSFYGVALQSMIEFADFTEHDFRVNVTDTAIKFRSGTTSDRLRLFGYDGPVPRGATPWEKVPAEMTGVGWASFVRDDEGSLRPVELMRKVNFILKTRVTPRPAQVPLISMEVRLDESPEVLSGWDIMYLHQIEFTKAKDVSASQ
nr:outer fiber [Largemouth bass reovirus]